MLGNIDSWSTVGEHSIQQRVLVDHLVLDLEGRNPTLTHVPILSWYVSLPCSRDGLRSRATATKRGSLWSRRHGDQMQDAAMPLLRIGETVIEMTDAVAEQWPALEAEAIAAAAARPHGRPIIYFRTDEGGIGIMGLPPHPATEAQEPATKPGIITEAALTHDGLSAHADPPQDRTDEEIAEMVREMKAERPDLDWDNSLSGRLLGPASLNRPDFPVWEYAVIADRDPDVRLEDLTAIRFPIRSLDGTLEVASVDEDLRPMPSHLASPPRPIPRWDARAIINRYVALHDAGLLEWDPHERGIVRLGTLDDLRPVLETWAATHLTKDHSSTHAALE